MRFLLILFIFIAVELTACGGVGSGRDERRVRDSYERDGDISDEDSEEEISDTVNGVVGALRNVNNFLKNCQSDIPNVPRNEMDVVLGAFGLGGINKFAQARECLEQRLQEITKRICQAKEDIYTQSQKYRNYDQRYERTQTAIDRIEDLHLRHQEWLLDQADRFHARADAKSSNSLLGQEWRAYAEIFESESYISCQNNRYDRYSGRSRDRRSYY